MEEQVNRLVEKVWEKYQETPLSKRFLIGIFGIPGAGKTTLAATVSSRINALQTKHFPAMATRPIAAFVPMDGYHLTRAQLSAMPDPVHAHARRGAAFTFDADAFVGLVRRLREPLAPETPTIYAPSFDHAVKDPVADDIAIAPTHRVVLLEGNYLGLDRPPWNDAAALLDELWFVDVPRHVATRRLVARHLRAGIAPSEEEASRRVQDSDLLNADDIIQHRVPNIHEMVSSQEDHAWTPEAQDHVG